MHSWRTLVTGSIDQLKSLIQEIQQKEIVTLKIHSFASPERVKQRGRTQKEGWGLDPFFHQVVLGVRVAYAWLRRTVMQSAVSYSQIILLSLKMTESPLK